MHQVLGPYDISAKGSPHRLVPQTHSQQRHLSDKMLDQLNANPAIPSGVHGPGEINIRSGDIASISVTDT